MTDEPRRVVELLAQISLVRPAGHWSKGPHAQPGSSKVVKGKGPKAKARPQLTRAHQKCTD